MPTPPNALRLVRPSDEASAPNACGSAGGKAPAARPRPLPVPAHPASGRWQLVSVGPNAANARSSRSTCIGASGRYASSPCNDQSPSVVLNDMPYSLMFCGYSTCNLAVSKPTTSLLAPSGSFGLSSACNSGTSAQAARNCTVLVVCLAQDSSVA